MLELKRLDGHVLRVGHRGAAALAPENTLAAFRAARASGVDLIELDVVDLPAGPLVVAHSRGETTPESPTLDSALAFFVEEAPELGVHLDLKLRTRLDELVAAVVRHGLEGRTVVSGVDVPALHAVRRSNSTIRVGFTYPRDRLGVSGRRGFAAVTAAGVATIRARLPRRVPALLRQSGATALMLEHRFVTPAVVNSAHAQGAEVLAWTVDSVRDLRRVDEAGVDGVITNDPGIFVATLHS